MTTTTDVTTMSRDEGKALIIERGRAMADTTVEALVERCPGHHARYYTTAITLSRLATDPETAGKPCVPVEIVARMIGLPYETKDDKYHFTTNYLTKWGVGCAEKSFGKTKIWFADQQSRSLEVCDQLFLTAPSGGRT